jgi:sulfite exporter TauE/SafE/copper chaperone CopZ
MKLTTEDIYIGGMTCINCQTRVQKALEKVEGVDAVRVSYADTVAHITYDNTKVGRKKLGRALQDAGYRMLDKPEKTIEGRQFAALVVIVVAAFLILNALGLNTLTGSFPLAEQGMGFAMLFVIGLLTSVHCVAMCGGINLSQCIPAVTAAASNTREQQHTETGSQCVVLRRRAGRRASDSPFSGKLAAARPSLTYNLGRVVSYTAVGALVGLLGSAITLNGSFKGAIQLVAGVFMVLMALSMLGIVPGLRHFALHLPAPLAKLVSSGNAGRRGPLIVGLLNGLMPCGPLQAMQLYALSTASPLEGALSMLAFSLGTVPLMFGLGLLSSVLTERFTKKIMLAGASLVMLLGLFMFANGWTLSNLPTAQDVSTIVGEAVRGGGTTGAGGNGATGGNGTGATDSTTGGADAKDTGILADDGTVQVVKSTLTTRNYPAIKVSAGVPVRWEIEAPKGTITGCNNTFVVPEYGLEYAFHEGTNVIEFTPEKTGKFAYSCWMGMIRSTITVS